MKCNASNGRRARPGFTLVEALVVVAIIALLAGLAVTRAGRLADEARARAAESDLRTLREALLDEGGYLADMRGIPGFSVGYLRVANLLVSTNLYGAVADGAFTTGCRVDDPNERLVQGGGCASPEAFTRWDAERGRGWRGPYLRHATATFPARGDRRFPDDATAEERGLYPPLLGLRLPHDILDGRDGCSVYGFPGEPALADPWGNPYVLQIPPPQAFPGASTNVADETRFRFARVVSAGPDGRLDAPCFTINPTNWWATAWNAERRRLSRQAGRNADGAAARGDDLVLFLNREDIDEAEETP